MGPGVRQDRQLPARARGVRSLSCPSSAAAPCGSAPMPRGITAESVLWIQTPALQLPAFGLR